MNWVLKIFSYLHRNDQICIFSSIISIVYIQIHLWTGMAHHIKWYMTNF